MLVRKARYRYAATVTRTIVLVSDPPAAGKMRRLAALGVP
jgi:hypothetical protein